MPDYQKAKIYKLWSPQGNEIYIGSTVNALERRKLQHKQKKDCCSKLLFEKYDDVRIEIIEIYPCENKMELNRREGEHIRNNNCINKRIEGRTKKEYLEDNKEKIKEEKKEYYENNKEKRKEQMKEYNKEYKQNNKEKIKEYMKEYNSKKVTCECGCEVRRYYLTQHKRTIKHTNFINQ